MKIYMTTGEAARRLRCTDTTIVNYIRRGRLIGHKPFSRWLVDSESVKKHLEKMQLKRNETTAYGRK